MHLYWDFTCCFQWIVFFKLQRVDDEPLESVMLVETLDLEGGAVACGGIPAHPVEAKSN